MSRDIVCETWPCLVLLGAPETCLSETLPAKQRPMQDNNAWQRFADDNGLPESGMVKLSFYDSYGKRNDRRTDKLTN